MQCRWYHQAAVVFTVVGFAPRVHAKSLSLRCYELLYICAPNSAGETNCMWMGGSTRERSIPLEKHPDYPSPTFPKKVWIGEHSEKFEDAVIDLTLQAVENDDGSVAGYFNTIAVWWEELTAESAGTTYLHAAVRTRNDRGFGWVCHSPILHAVDY